MIDPEDEFYNCDVCGEFECELDHDEEGEAFDYEVYDWGYDGDAL